MFGVFEEIEKLIEYIPITSYDNEKSDAKFEAGVSTDSRFPFNDLDGVAVRLGILEMQDHKVVVSFRDIIKLLNKFLKDASINELKIKNTELQKTGNDYAESYMKSLLFDFCLAALDEDEFDAKLYLLHSMHFTRLRKRLILILLLIVNEPSLRTDRDVRHFLARLAIIVEPNNIDRYFDVNNNGFHRRYSTYVREMQSLLMPLLSGRPESKSNNQSKMR